MLNLLIIQSIAGGLHLSSKIMNQCVRYFFPFCLAWLMTQALNNRTHSGVQIEKQVISYNLSFHVAAFIMILSTSPRKKNRPTKLIYLALNDVFLAAYADISRTYRIVQKVLSTFNQGGDCDIQLVFVSEFCLLRLLQSCKIVITGSHNMTLYTKIMSAHSIPLVICITCLENCFFLLFCGSILKTHDI